jgi:general secretion pathway protein L
MQHYFLVYPQSDDWQQVSWCAYGPDLQVRTVVGSLESLAQAAQLTPIMAVLPGRWLNFFQVELPKARGTMIKQALPFLLEEQLAQELDNIHIALPTHYQGGEITPVAVINKERMQTLQAAFKGQNLNLQQAFPDWMCLPLFDHTWTIHLGSEYAYVRQSTCLGFSIQKDLLMPMLQMALAQTLQPPQALHVYHLALEAADMEEQLNTLSLPLAYEAVSDDPLLVWAQYFSSPAPLNLLQDEFFIKPKVSEVNRLWRIAATLVVAIIAVQLCQSFLRYQQLSKQYTQVHEEVLTLYTQVFPDATQTSNAKAQLEQALAGKGGARADNPLFAYLQDIATPLLNTEGITLQQLTFQNNEMRLQIIAKDFATLSQLESALGMVGLSVKQEGASLEENQVSAQLHISRGA